ncbi:MAG: ATPase [Fretibacterium sp.]|nr:ATPase [Fretibacterium sp.]
MAVVRMASMAFVGPVEEIERVALLLLQQGCFEPVSPMVMMEGRPLSGRFRSFRSNRYDALLEKLEGVWGQIGHVAPQVPLGEYPQADFKSLEEQVDSLAHMGSGWRARIDSLSLERVRFAGILALTRAVHETGRSLMDIVPEPNSMAIMGVLSKENWQRLREASQTTPALALPLAIEGDRVATVVFCSSDYQSEVEKICASVHMKVFTRTLADLAPYDDVKELESRLASIEAELISYQEMPERYVRENIHELERLYGIVYAMQRVYTLCQLRLEFSGMMTLAGWIPRALCEPLKEQLAEEAPHTIVMVKEDEELKESNTLPTLLKNLPGVRKFQEIVRLYSLPAYDELDPTFAVCVSFCLFFGMMFGDVGHGLMLMLATWLMVKKGKMGKPLGAVMQIAGMSAVVFGFLYGSVFGDEELIRPLWLSPMKDVDLLMPVAVGVGVLFLSLGNLFRVWNCAKKRKWGEALFSPEGLAGLLFYWLAVLSVVLALGESGAPWMKSSCTALMFFLFLVMGFSNLLSRWIFGEEPAGEGGAVHAFSLFHTMLSFISNTASFVRLAAFALNHAGLCGAVVMLGEMVEQAPGGRVLNGFVIIAGHLVIVALEGLIVFIQTLRLEYYEFFGKFFQGGGRSFEPVLWRR